MKLHLFTLLLLMHFALNSSEPGIVFSFLKKEFTLSGFSVFSFKESIDFGTSTKNELWKNNQTAYRVGFHGKNHAFPLW